MQRRGRGGQRGLRRAGSAISSELIERLYANEKVCPERVRWRPESGSKTRLRFEVAVYEVATGQKLTFRGVYQRSLKGRRYAFCLTLYRNITVRRYDQSKHHKELYPRPHWIRQPHKHRFVNEEHPDAAYGIPDGEIADNDVNQAFFDFLAECSITMTAPYEQILPEVI